MRVVYVTTGVWQKRQNADIRTINLNNYKTLMVCVINSVKNL